MDKRISINRKFFIMLLVTVLVTIAGLILLSTSAKADWNEGDPHKMHFPQLPDPQGWDIKFGTPEQGEFTWIGDDWKCSETGPVSDIHFWFSWQGDTEGMIENIKISIYDDVRPPEDYSRPGQELWSGIFLPGQFVIRPYGDGTQGWYDPFINQFNRPDHNNFYQVNITDIQEPFMQDLDKIYWLVIDLDVNSEQIGFAGWKTSLDHFEDQAVYLEQLTGWKPLSDPETGIEIDLAFVVSDGSAPVDEFDWGDAPDGAAAAMYPTLAVNNGANHLIDKVTWLGPMVDAELDGQPDAAATGDDTLDGSDDEDGVTLTSLMVPGGMTTLDVVASTTGLLNAWVDFNIDGNWGQADEQIFIDKPLSAGLNSINFLVPATATPGTTFLRFRFDTNGGLSYDGPAEDGEVEDYMDIIQEAPEDIDWGDAPDRPYPTLLASTGASHIIDGITFMGALVDPELDGQPNATATGDDLLDGSDDEDGVTFTTPLVSGLIAGVDVVASTSGYLNVWIDFDGNGNWLEPYDRVFTDQNLSAGNNSLTFFIPPTGFLGNTFARFRFTSDNTTNQMPFFGPWSNGEVEDYQIEITQEVSRIDWGDAPDSPTGGPSYPTLAASNGANHLIDGVTFMGILVDGEPDGQPTVPADGDDNNPSTADDEDGVIFTLATTVGGALGVDVLASAPGSLNVWFDANINSSWADPEDHILVDHPMVPGVNSLFIPLPLNTVAGSTYARFRFSTVPGLSFDGPAQDGEVEDYAVTVWEEVMLDYGDAPDQAGALSYPTLLANNGARHIVTGQFYLGMFADTELDGQPHPQALGDDLAGSDDEDGVNFTTPLNIGQPATVDVTVISSPGYLNAWIDFNMDGDWADANEQIITDANVIPGTQTINFAVPASALNGKTFARFRLDSNGGLSYAGLAPDGEVEDYMVEVINQRPTITIVEPDGTNDIADTSYTITWTDSDPDDDASISLYYDNDNTGLDGTLIVSGISEDDPADSYNWDTSTMTAGDYYIYGIINDGVNPQVSDYSNGPLTISNHAPTIQVTEPDGTGDLAENSFTIEWVDEDVDDNAAVTLFYDTDNTGVDGVQITDCDPISEDDTTDSCNWDTSAVAERGYYIYAVIDDGVNAPVVDYSEYPVVVNRQGMCPMSLCNGDFEAATDLDYWKPGNGTNQITTAVVQDGAKAYYTEQTFDTSVGPRWSGIWQNVLVESAQTYALRGYYQSENAAYGHIKVAWKDIAGTVIQVNYPVTNINGTNSSWIEFSKLIIAPAGAVTAELKIWHGVDITVPENVLGSKLWMDTLTFEVATTACGTLCNESFEHGLLFWTPSGKVGSQTIETTAPHEGLKYLKSEQQYLAGDPIKWAGVMQFGQVKAGTTYRLRVWLQTLNAATGHVRIRWRDTGGALISTQYPITGVPATNAAWFSREANVTAPASATTAEIAIWHGVAAGSNSPGSTMWVDDITMICLTLCNGGFEDGTIHWEANGINEGEIQTTGAQEGTQSIKVVQSLDASAPAQWAGISQRTLVTGGNNYTLSFWIKKDNTERGHVKVKWRDSNDQFISQQFPIGGITGTDMTWTNLTTVLTAPATAETVEIFIWHGVDATNNNAQGSTLYIDNVTLL